MNQTNLELLLDEIGPVIASECQCYIPRPQLVSEKSDRKIIDAIALKEERGFISAAKPFLTETVWEQLKANHTQKKLLFSSYAPSQSDGQALFYANTIFYDPSLDKSESERMLAHELSHLAFHLRHPIMAVLQYLILSPKESSNPLLPYENWNASRLFNYFKELFAETMSIPALNRFQNQSFDVFLRPWMYRYVHAKGRQIVQEYPEVKPALITKSVQESTVSNKIFSPINHYNIPQNDRRLAVLDDVFSHVEKAYLSELKLFKNNPENHPWTSNPEKFGKTLFQAFTPAFGIAPQNELRLKTFYTISALLDMAYNCPLLVPFWTIGEIYFAWANKLAYDRTCVIPKEVSKNDL